MQEVRRKKRRNKYEPLKRKFPKSMQKKLAVQFILVVLAFFVLIGRVIYINVEKGDEYKQKVLDQQSYGSRTIPYKRGDIVDAKGTVLATSERVYNVILDVKNLLDTTENNDNREVTISQTAAVLEEVFGIEQDKVTSAIIERPTSRYVILKKSVDYDTAKLFEKYDDVKNLSESAYAKLEETVPQYPYLSSIWLEEDYIRTYPYSSLASGVLGFAGSSNTGVGGLEEYYNSTLNGIDGKEYGYFYDDATEITVEAAKNGNTVVTSIDQTLQSIVEKYIREFNEEYTDNAIDGPGSKNTAVVVTNPNTGEILASATYPNYDLNNPGDLSQYYTTEEISAMTEEETSAALNTLRTNYVVTNTFEAGSPIKPFTVAAAIEEGCITGEESYVCTGGIQIGPDYISCVNIYGHGELTVQEAISESCNSVMMQIADQIGIEDFAAYQTFFGFGQKTNIDLPNEAITSGLLHSADTMTTIDMYTSSFGQSFNVTMIQMVSSFGALVNGGDYFQPHIVTQIQDASGRVIENIEPTLVKKIVSEDTSAIIRDDLRAVVAEGTGSHASVEEYEVGGKTGTAEKLPRGNEKYVVSFMGCVPATDPEILIYVVIDEPNVEEQASSLYAQTMASNIMQEALPYLGVTTLAEMYPELSVDDDTTEAVPEDSAEEVKGDEPTTTEESGTFVE